MKSCLSIITGPAHSGKTQHALEEYRSGLQTLSPGSCLWLSPTSRSARVVQECLLLGGERGYFRPNVMTFERFAATVIAHGETVVRPLSPWGKRALLRSISRRLLAESQLPYFGEISQTSGFIAMLSAFISEIKRLEIWPDHFREACQRRGTTKRDAEILRIYERYQQELNDRRLYDAEGQFWSARTMIQQGRRAPFENLRLIIADGFTDFTSTQHEILELLAKTDGEPTPRMIVTLPMDAGANLSTPRDELFAKPLATLKRLQAGFPGPAMTPKPRKAQAGWRAVSHLEEHLFAQPEDRQPLPAVRMELIEAGGGVAEFEEIARRVKQLLTVGDTNFIGTRVHPRDVLIVLRTVDEHSVLIRETFSRYGIPISLESGQRAAETGMFRAVLQVLALALEDWPHRRVLSVLNNNYLRPGNMGEVDRLAAVKLVRSLQVPQGCQELLRSAEGYLDWLERRQKDRPAGRPPAVAEKRADDQQSLFSFDDNEANTGWEELGMPNVASCRRGVGLLNQLRDAVDALPPTATLAQWGKALEELADALGLCHQVSASNDELSRLDAQAWQALIDAIPQLARALSHGKSVTNNGPADAISLSDLQRLIVDFGQTTRISSAQDAAGCVSVLSAKTARALETPYLFFAGLTERAFPAAQSAESLYSEADKQRLRESGLPIPTRTQRYCEEMLLFYEVITRATRSLWLSYPAFDERAEPLLSSPFVQEVQRAFGEGNLPCRKSESLSPIPQDPACCEDEWRLIAVSDGLARKPARLSQWVATQPADRGASLLAAMETIASRGKVDRFGAWEGLMHGPRITREIGAYFENKGAWSATDLESYASCPYEFFLSRILKLKPVEDLQLEIDHLSRGRLLHEVLYRLQRKINKDHGGATSPASLSRDDYRAAAAESIDAVMTENPAPDALRGAMREIDRRLMTAWVDEYRDQHAEYDAKYADLTRPMLPSHFEIAFGMEDAAGDELSMSAPFQLKHKGETLPLRGRIDRIDLGHADGRNVFNVIDFKSGRFPPSHKERIDPHSARLQIELYTLAAREMLGDLDAEPIMSTYWFLAAGGAVNWRRYHEINKKSGRLSPAREWAEREPILLDLVFGLARGMRQAEFPVFSASEKCTTFCEFATACRINHIRALDKEWKPRAQ